MPDQEMMPHRAVMLATEDISASRKAVRTIAKSGACRPSACRHERQKRKGSTDQNAYPGQTVFTGHREVFASESRGLTADRQAIQGSGRDEQIGAASRPG